MAKIKIESMTSLELVKLINQDRCKRDKTPMKHFRLLTIIRQDFEFGRDIDALQPQIKKIIVDEKEKKILQLTKEQVREILLKEHEEYREHASRCLERIEQFGTKAFNNEDTSKGE